ncbi:MAG: right-handed parallel beta-helix repeat-containing protein [Promethearchaeota archaeon]
MGRASKSSFALISMFCLVSLILIYPVTVYYWFFDRSRNYSGSEVCGLAWSASVNKLRTSSYVLTQYKTHSPIWIEGNAHFITLAKVNNWPGNGTPSSPILICNLNITGPFENNLINIQDTNIHFRISNCFFCLGQDGIYFGNVTNGQLSNNIITKNNVRGIDILHSGRITLFNNTVNNNHWEGIHLSDSFNNHLFNNTISYNQREGISLSNSFNNLLSTNIINNNGDDGITLSNSDNTALSENIVAHNNEIGISLFNTDNAAISENIVAHNNETGISLATSTARISNNTVVNNKEDGIRLDLSFSNILSGNTISNNNRAGILVYLSDGNVFSGNTIASNNKTGFSLRSSTENSLFDNNVTNNDDSGISISDSDSCTLSSNIIANNSGYGINFESSDNGIISNNTITNNYGYGVSLQGGSYNNRVLFNDFSGNIATGSQAADNGSSNIFTFNFWNDWTTPDNDTDGIVDEPYDIAGSVNNQDIYPLTSSNRPQNHFIVGLTVLYPNGGETFSGRIMILWTDCIDSWGHSVSYSVYYSFDSGITWVTLGSRYTSTWYVWDTTTVADGTNYLIKVNVSCAEGIWNVDTSDNTFTINNSRYTTIITSLGESTSTSVSGTRKDANNYPSNVIGGLIIIVLITAALILHKEIVKRRK